MNYYDITPENPEPPITSICDYPSQPLSNWFGQKTGKIYTDNNGNPLPKTSNGRDTRIKHERWRVSYVLYSSIGFRVKFQKKTKFAGCQKLETNYIIGEACIKGTRHSVVCPDIDFNEQTSPVWPNLKVQPGKKLQSTIIMDFFGCLPDIVLEHFNLHFKVNYKGAIVERYIVN